MKQTIFYRAPSIPSWLTSRNILCSRSFLIHYSLFQYHLHYLHVIISLIENHEGLYYCGIEKSAKISFHINLRKVWFYNRIQCNILLTNNRSKQFMIHVSMSIHRSEQTLLIPIILQCLVFNDDEFRKLYLVKFFC